MQRRLEDEADFSKVAYVKGNDTRNEATPYTLEDLNAARGISYYRLKQIDKNGSSHLSEVVAVPGFLAEGFAVSLSPNPAKDELNVHIAEPLAGFAGDLSYVVRDLAGRAVMEGEWSLGQVKFEVANVGDLQAGVYLLEVTDGKYGNVAKFVKE